ncbi:hypothetical protein [Chitinophaga sp.]
MPVALGKGRPLFSGIAFEKQFTVARTKVYASGVIEAVMSMMTAVN